jgi:hypothetical protein
MLLPTKHLPMSGWYDRDISGVSLGDIFTIGEE